MTHRSDFRAGPVDHLHRAVEFLAAASSASSAEIKSFYLARARGERELAAKALASLDLLLNAQEAELARIGMPK